MSFLGEKIMWICVCGVGWDAAVNQNPSSLNIESSLINGFVNCHQLLTSYDQRPRVMPSLAEKKKRNADQQNLHHATGFVVRRVARRSCYVAYFKILTFDPMDCIR